MAFKLTTMGRTFVPSVMWVQEDDTKVNNRDLGPSEQVTVELELADSEERADFSQAHYGDGDVKLVPKHRRAVKKKVKSIKGLEDFKITDGRTLINHKPCKEFDQIIEECYNKIMGTHDDDLKKGSDSGEMTAGE